MMKRIILLTLVFFMYGCGYSSVYKDLEKRKIQLEIISMQGDRDINNHIKNEIALYSDKVSTNKFEIEINTSYEKLILAKNSLGSATDYRLSASSTFTISSDQKSTKTTFNETINIKSQTDSFEQDIYEKNIKRNFASSIREKLILNILINNDY